MRTHAKTLVVAAAMVVTFAIMPVLGAAAAEPLGDGSYDVTIGETTHTVEVVEGVPAVEGAEGVEFTFAFDEENRVLDEFGVTVDGVVHDVTVADDGTVTVTVDDGESQVDEDDGDDQEPAEDPEDDGEGEDPAEGDSEDVEPLEEDDEDGDVEALEEGEEADDGHGALVATVAHCAPKAREARAAGLPNHGFFVSAAAKGAAVEFEADGATHSADLTSQAGADAFCALAEELLAAAAPEPEAESGTAAAEVDRDGDSVDGGDKGKGRGNGHGRADAPGQKKKGR